MNCDESARIDEVMKFLNLDITHRQELKDITKLATQLCDKPISLITLLGKDDNYIKAATGISVEISPRNISFCQYGINNENVLVIPDATQDERFIDNPMVTADPGVRFYAGAPLVSNSGHTIGMLCLFDTHPNTLNEEQQNTLAMLSRQVILLLELDLSKAQLEAQLKEIELKNESLRSIAQMQSHEIRHPLAMIMGLVNLVRDDMESVNEEWLDMMNEATGILDSKINAIVNESLGHRDMKMLKFNKMVEEIEDYAILLLNERGYIENWNKGAQQIKGYRAGEIVGKNFEVFYTREDRERMLPQHLLGHARMHGVARNEGWRVRKDGSIFWARVVITAIHNDDGEIIGFTKVTRDLTNTKEAQAR